MSTQESPTPSEKLGSNSKKSKTTHFVLNLYELLTQSENYSDIVSWSEDGSYFIINQPESFAEKILPLYYRHHQLASFIRQLNMYGFKSKSCPKGSMAYFHPYFQKESKELLYRVERNKNFRKYSQPKVQKSDSQSVIDQLQSENKQLKETQMMMFSKLADFQSQIDSLVLNNNALEAKLQKMEALFFETRPRFEGQSNEGFGPNHPSLKRIKTEPTPVTYNQEMDIKALPRILEANEAQFRFPATNLQPQELAYPTQFIDNALFVHRRSQQALLQELPEKYRSHQNSEWYGILHDYLE